MCYLFTKKEEKDRKPLRKISFQKLETQFRHKFSSSKPSERLEIFYKIKL
ncbi:hypothetical protein LEP1GSC052_0361 [Leptospira kmetyi serovar Malaysia str. Bejo-Iso9]|nr:hypothetical protein LEP1GSC052_0361 [Leptospira kmetyi serovar Malaysia str. Bejo-Iso9]